MDGDVLSVDSSACEFLGGDDLFCSRSVHFVVPFQSGVVETGQVVFQGCCHWHWACGLPVVASSADGFREVLQGGAGILVPIEDVSAAADAMLLLATEPDLRHSIGQTGRERAVKCYDWRDNVALMTEEYSRLCRKI